MFGNITGISLWDLVKHAGRWIANLKRAKDARKKESIKALRRVVIAARETAVYMRRLKDTGRRSHQKEAKLSRLWTELGFALEDLGILNLAKRCNIKGKHWADPARIDHKYFKKADTGLERMEQQANEIIKDITNAKKKNKSRSSKKRS